MRIPSLFQKGTVLSFEVFPPKREAPIESLYDTLGTLCELHPDFVSVTYGAGGSSQNRSTLEIATLLKQKYGTEPLAHLTCLNLSKAEVLEALEGFRANGIENIMALRGDRNPDIEPKREFLYASELVAFIRANGDFGISGACYPETHLEAASPADDLRHLKRKVEAGAEHLVSQLFFDNDLFFDFLGRARTIGIRVPIEAGIMPVVNRRQIERMVTLCGASLPAKFVKMMQRYEAHPKALRDAGIAYATDQIVDLVARGVDGIHLYTMNNPYVARRITENVERLIRL